MRDAPDAVARLIADAVPTTSTASRRYSSQPS